jgi:hypothetical protein
LLQLEWLNNAQTKRDMGGELEQRPSEWKLDHAQTGDVSKYSPINSVALEITVDHREEGEPIRDGLAELQSGPMLFPR